MKKTICGAGLSLALSSLNSQAAGLRGVAKISRSAASFCSKSEFHATGKKTPRPLRPGKPTRGTPPGRCARERRSLPNPARDFKTSRVTNPFSSHGWALATGQQSPRRHRGNIALERCALRGSNAIPQRWRALIAQMHGSPPTRSTQNPIEEHQSKPQNKQPPERRSLQPG